VSSKETAFAEVTDTEHPYLVLDYRKGGYHLIPMMVMIVITVFQDGFIN
jgi:hypothetical protein